MSMPDVDPAQFRQLCGRFATGVVVITATGPDGAPAGMTANSFTSVSLEPPLVSVNVDRASDFHAVVTAAEGFVVNVLSSEQEATSRRFAGPAPHRFDGIGYRQVRGGRVVLEGVIAAIQCERHATVEAGDHTVVIGRVVGGEVHDGRPLLYFRGGYHTMA
jgi:3-hydroxy-9,10-secoandrosta-1,3,5(10)-triene-9,17-dione monooxygenase reductase component